MERVAATGWQLVQDNSGLTVLVSGLASDPDVLRQAIEQALRSRGAVVPAIRIERVPAIPRSASGKAPLIKRHLPRRDSGPACSG
jgi:hypothetical protein